MTEAEALSASISTASGLAKGEVLSITKPVVNDTLSERNPGDNTLIGYHADALMGFNLSWSRNFFGVKPVTSKKRRLKFERLL